MPEISNSPPPPSSGEPESILPREDLTPKELDLVDRIKHIPDPILTDPKCASVANYVTELMKAVVAEEARTIPEDDYSAAGGGGGGAAAGGTVRPNVTLLCSTAGGYGDISFIHKAAIGLLAKGCKVNVAVAKGIWRSSSFAAKTMQAMPKGGEINIYTENEHPEDMENSDYLIIGPTIPKYDEVLSQFPWLDGVPYQYIQEYGAKSSIDIHDGTYETAQVAGLEPHQMGIFVGDGLRPLLLKSDKAAKLGALVELFPSEMSLLLENTDPENYLDQKSLFFGYAHLNTNMEKFVALATLSEAESEKDIDIVLPWRAVDGDGTANYSDAKCKLDFDALRSANISHVDIVTRQGVENIAIPNAEGTKTLRLINYSHLDHHLFVELMDVSEDLVLLSGDQSLNEALSMPSKIPLYEILAWKLSVANSMEKIAGKFSSSLFELMRKWRESKTGNDILPALTSVYAENKTAEKKSAKSPVRLFHEEVFKKEHDLVQNLHQAILKQMALKDSHLQKVATQLEGALKETFLLHIKLEKTIKDLMHALLVYANTKHLELSDFLTREKGWIEKEDTSGISSDLINPVRAGFALLQKAEAGEEVLGQEIYSVARTMMEAKQALNKACSALLAKFQKEL